MKKIKISIAEDHEVIRKGLVKLLNDFEEFEVIFDASNGEELIQRIKLGQTPDLVLLDIDMPVLDGAETLKILRQNFGKEMMIIALSMHTEFYMVQYMLEAGANGFVAKHVSPTELREALHKAVKNKFYLSDDMSKLLYGSRYQTKNLQHELNKVEIEIVRLICEQKNNKEIGRELRLSHNTINTYRTKILEKVGAVNTAGLVIYAIKSGLYRV